MRVKGIIISLLVLAALAAACAAVQPGYEGRAKVVLQLAQMSATPTPMPMGMLSASMTADNRFAETAYPDVPQGTLLQADVLYSGDPMLKAGDKCTLLIEYDNSNVPAGLKANLLDKLVPGAVVGVNDYTLKGSQVTVDIGNTTAWDKKVSILDMQYTKPGETNPFKIDLNLFKGFTDYSSASPYGNITATPKLPKPSLWPTPSTFPVLGNGLSDMFSRFFGM